MSAPMRIARRRPEPEETAPAAAPRRMATAAARSRSDNRETRSSRHTSTKYTSRNTESEQETAEAEDLETVRFAPGEEPAFVRVSAGKTINMGNYDSLRVEVSVTLPCLPEQIEATYEAGSQFVAEKLVLEEQNWIGVPTNRSATRRR